MNTIEQLKLVTEFMNTAGQAVNNEPTYQSTKIADFRTRLIQEEIYGKNELVDSINNDNIVGIVDGLCDILYVVYGAIATYGVDMGDYPIFERTTGRSVLMHKHVASRLLRDVDYALQQYIRGVETGDMMTVRRGLTGIIHEVNRIASESNVDLANAFSEVHASNMSKFCTSEEHAKESTLKRILAEDDKTVEYVNSHIEKRGQYWLILRNSDDKILKGSNFFEPDLSKYA